MIGVKADTSRAKAFLAQLERTELPRVIGRSLTRTGDSTRSAASKELRQRLNLQKQAVDAMLRTRRQTSDARSLRVAFEAGMLWVEVVATGKPIALREFQARKTRVDGSRNLATFKVRKGGSRKPYFANDQPGFIVDRFGGHVFVRRGIDPPGPAKALIRKVFGPSIPQYFSTRRVRALLIEHAMKTWEKEIEANTRNAIRRRT